MVARTRFLRLTAIAAIVATGAVASTAFAQRDGASPLQLAIAKTAAASSSKFNFTFGVSGVTGLPGGRAITLKGSGASDTKHGTAIIHLNLGSLAPSLGALTQGAAVPSTIDVLVVRNVLYVHFPAFAAKIRPGAEWLKLDPKTLPKTATGGANVGQLTSLDQKKLLAALASAVTVKPVGTFKIGGVSTTHYAGTIDMNAFAAALPKEQRSSFQAAVKQVGLTSVPFDVWIDGQHLIRRLGVRLAHLKVQGAGAAISLRAQVNLFGFGTPLKVVAPPASKTADAGKLLGSLGTGTSSG